MTRATSASACGNGQTNGETSYDPDHNYQVKAVYLPTKADGTREHQTLYRYDERDRLASVTQQRCNVEALTGSHTCLPGTVVAAGSHSYAYDDNDNVTQVVESAEGTSSTGRRYCYDALDGLVYRNTGPACSATAKDESYAYGDAGNRTAAAAGGVPPASVTLPTGDCATSESVSCPLDQSTWERQPRQRRPDPELQRLDLRLRRRRAPDQRLQVSHLRRRSGQGHLRPAGTTAMAIVQSRLERAPRVLRDAPWRRELQLSRSTLVQGKRF